MKKLLTRSIVRKREVVEFGKCGRCGSALKDLKKMSRFLLELIHDLLTIILSKKAAQLALSSTDF